MSDARPETDRRDDWLRGLLRLLVTGLVLAGVVLALLVRHVASGPPGTAADVGEKVPMEVVPYGHELTVELPGSVVTVTVGDPQRSVDHDLLDVGYDDPRWGHQKDLTAPDGGALVPVSWQVKALGGITRKDDPRPIAIRLTAGDQEVDLASVVLGDFLASLDAFDETSVAAVLAGSVDVDDLAVEVEYDGLTQTAHVASGQIDAGVAQALYDDGDDYDPGCFEVEDQCRVHPADPDSPLRPDGGALVSYSYLSLYPYESALGWAPEGTLWAGYQLHLLPPTDVKDAAGHYRLVDRQSAPTITLDGAAPVRREGLGATTFSTTGRMVYRVATDARPRHVDVAAVYTLRGSRAPHTLRVETRLRLRSVG